MPKLTLLLGRRTLEIYDLDQSTIRVGREPGMDVVIDNPSVSRKHAEIRREGEGWVLEDLESSNGTFLHGDRVRQPTSLEPGDEIGFGKFSLVFEKAVGEASPPKSRSQPGASVGEGTMHMKSRELNQLLEKSERQRRAHVVWESGGERGTHYLSDEPAVLFGRDSLCDVTVPKAPKHHVLVVKRENGCEIRNLHWWSTMRVRGVKTKRAILEDGDVAEVGGLRITFVDELA